MQAPQVGQVVVDHVAAFDAHQHGDAPRGRGAPDAVGSRHELEVVRMRSHLALDGLDLLQRLGHRFLAGGRAWNPDREEDRVESALAHARDVDAAVRVAIAQVEGRIEQPLRGVVVRVDDQGIEMEFARDRRVGTAGSGRRQRQAGHPGQPSE